LIHIELRIYLYEAALELAPNGVGVDNQVPFERHMTVDAIHHVAEAVLEKYIRKVTTTHGNITSLKLPLVCIPIFVVEVVSHYFADSATKTRLAFVRSMLSLGFTCLALIFAYHKFELDKKHQPAIIFAQESQVKSEPNLRSTEAFILHEGTKVQILDTVNNWK